MSEIRITFQSTPKTQTKTVVGSVESQQFIEHLRVGEVLNAQLKLVDGKYYLQIKNTELLISELDVKQWQLKEHQFVKLKVKSLTGATELQIIPNRSYDQRPNVQRPTDDVSISRANAELVKNNQGVDRNNSEQPVNKDVLPPRSDNDKLILEVRRFLNSTQLANSAATTHSLTEQVSTQTSTSNVRGKPVDNSSQLPTTTAKTAIIQQTSDKTDKLFGKSGLLPLSKQPNLNPDQNPKSVTTKQVEVSNVGQAELKQIAQKEKPFQQTTIQHSSNLNPSSLNPSSQQPINQLPSTQQQVNQQPNKQTPKINLNIQTKQKSNPSSGTKNTSVADAMNSLIQYSKSAINHSSLRSQSDQRTEISTNSHQASPKNIPQNTNEAAPAEHNNLKHLNLEIPVSIPDKDAFPLLSEKINAAYTRLVANPRSTTESFSKLLAQLNRLNQWSADNKSSRRSESGSQSEKLAADLKESLKDLFRYITPKENIKSAKSVERALRQSGTFLEKRMVKKERVSEEKKAKATPELTIHKDLKANLNRVMATSLYNLAKLKMPAQLQQTAPSTATINSQQNSSLNKNNGVNPTVTVSSSELLGQSKSNLLNNIKNKLIQYSSNKANATNTAELEAITKDVLKHTQAAVSRSQLTQLTNLRPETSAQQWLFEIPVFNKEDIDLFMLYMREHKKEEQNSTETKKWSIVMQFDIGGLGKIRAMLSWNKSSVEVKFFAENENTVELVSDELSYFKKLLNNQGLSFNELSVEQAKLDELSIQFSKAESNV